MPNRVIDLRSDTVTLPTIGMRSAMQQAVVGDDVYGEDPTVNDLEKRVADLCKKDAALFVPSGTMANLIAVMSHCSRGDEMILGADSHIYYYEQGGSASIGGIHPRPVLNQKDGSIGIDDILAAIRPLDMHSPITRLLCLENTHNRMGGRVLKMAYLNEIANLKAQTGLSMHLDGARLWNAAVALDTGISTLVAMFDSVSLCFSKGLGAPVGSTLVGDLEFIQRARRLRKVLGGGMRQAGVLASAALVALDEIWPRLKEDHLKAQQLARGLSKNPFILIDETEVDTNMVRFRLTHKSITPKDLVHRLKNKGILMHAVGGPYLRAVTHFDITEADIGVALDAIAESLA